MGLSKDYDGLHDMDGCDDFHPCFCTVLARLGIWRGNVWHIMGCFPDPLHSLRFRRLVRVPFFLSLGLLKIERRPTSLNSNVDVLNFS